MYGMVASGYIEIVLEDTLKAHDYMALVPIIEGAGGKISDKYGKNINIYSEGSVIASANDQLHKQLINIINSNYSSMEFNNRAISNYTQNITNYYLQYSITSINA